MTDDADAILDALLTASGVFMTDTQAARARAAIDQQLAARRLRVPGDGLPPTIQRLVAAALAIDCFGNDRVLHSTAALFETLVDHLRKQARDS